MYDQVIPDILEHCGGQSDHYRLVLLKLVLGYTFVIAVYIGKLFLDCQKEG